ncbi:NADH-quinone oxidoreductase subunit F [Platysternon megacephalum]|uniref:Pyridoxal phosphate homeostasis protein n=1 Tax=Platysternon megacephalum TaxID=55544 RepID=A0A4D9DJL9_9SAUR|nr:NADH-quinone oxidoreductase subunit F [Platysternon megacephalum]
MTSDVAANLSLIESRIQLACARAGRARDQVRLLPVSKTKPPSSVQEAYDVGYRRFGENKVQEAEEKYEALQGLPGIEWAVIGHLQSNKARVLARFAAEFQALDSLKLAIELDRRLESEDRTLDVLIQVNSSAEPQKFGIDPIDAVQFARDVRSCERLQVKGLMTLAVFSSDVERVAPCFKLMTDVQRRLREVDGGGWDELSMGMSGDFELAIAHGATCVRVGQAIFGNRLDPNAYWPGLAG